MRNGWSCRVLQALSSGTKIFSDGPNWRPACLVYFRTTETESNTFSEVEKPAVFSSEILEPKVDYLKEVHLGGHTCGNHGFFSSVAGNVRTDAAYGNRVCRKVNHYFI